VATEDQAMRMLRALDRRELAAHRLRMAVRRALGVREEELLVLRHLAEHGDASQAELASFTGLSRSGIGALVQRLERDALIERHPHPSDRRIRRVGLTARSRAQLALAYADLQAGVAALLAPLADGERAAIERFLDAAADLTEHQVRRSACEPAPEPSAPTAPSDWALWG
jgi:DNA-binding MarR family transcriptional regulator